MSCGELRPYLEAYVDEELSPERTLLVTAHLKACPCCTVEVQLTRSMKRTLRAPDPNAVMSAHFAARLQTRLAEECRKQSEEHHPVPFHEKVKRPLPLKHRPLHWKSIAPLAAAAAAVLSFGASQNQALESAKKTQVASVGPESLVDLLVQHHTKGAQPELVDTRDVGYLEPELGFPIHLPNLDGYGARFVGASRLSTSQGRAASLHYNINGHRVTLYVYNPDDLPLRTMRTLQPTVVGNRAVFVGHRRGYSIASYERQGVGYAVAADMSDEESAELVAAVAR